MATILPSVDLALFRGAALVALAAACVAIPPLGGGRALAATVTAPAVVTEITVLAPVVLRKPGPIGQYGQPTEILTLERRVSFSDLDLAKPSDADELRSRVKQAAERACADLEARAPSDYGGPTASEQNCEHAAEAEALMVVDQLAAAAK